MWLAIAPGPTIRWLFRSHDLPSKFSAITSRLYRVVKHMHACWEILLLFQLFFLCLTLFYRGKTSIIQIFKSLCGWMKINCLQFLSMWTCFLELLKSEEECSVFYSFSCSSIPLYPEELLCADLMHHMHKRWGDDTGQPESKCRSRSAEHSMNTLECQRTSCMPHEYGALGCKGGMWIGLLP